MVDDGVLGISSKVALVKKRRGDGEVLTVGGDGGEGVVGGFRGFDQEAMVKKKRRRRRRRGSYGGEGMGGGRRWGMKKEKKLEKERKKKREMGVMNLSVFCPCSCTHCCCSLFFPIFKESGLKSSSQGWNSPEKTTMAAPAVAREWIGSQERLCVMWCWGWGWGFGCRWSWGLGGVLVWPFGGGGWRLRFGDGVGGGC